LAHLRPVPTGTFSASAQQNKLQFERISNTSTLDGVLAEAKGKGQTVMLDFYADWCVSCKEYESFTFSHPDVQKRLEKVRLVQADVTANREEDKALLKRFNLFGPPGVVIFSANKEVSQPYKVVGYQAPTEFLASLNSAAVP
jgi:thiol:disulfide interchange protein DsbD